MTEAHVHIELVLLIAGESLPCLFQVAIVTGTRVRAENLKAEIHAAMPAAQQRAYHFIALEDLTLEVFWPVLHHRHREPESSKASETNAAPVVHRWKNFEALTQD